MLTNNQMGPPEKPIAAEKQIISLGRVLQKLREEDNVEVLIETTIAYIKEQFDHQLIWIALYDRLNHTLSGKGGITPTKDTNFLQQVVIEQRPLGVADLKEEHRAETLKEVAKKFQIQGTVIFPIRYRDRCLGLVLLGSQRWGYLLATEAKARLLIVLAELGGVLYQHEIDLLQKQTKRIEEPLLRLLENLRSLTNFDQKLETVVEATHQFPDKYLLVSTRRTLLLVSGEQSVCQPWSQLWSPATSSRNCCTGLERILLCFSSQSNCLDW
jgi:hypothetical protein